MTLIEKSRRALAAVPEVFMAEGFWYLVLAGAAWLGFHVIFAGVLRRRRIVRQTPSWRQMGWEVAYSLRSLLIFGIVGGLLLFAILSGWTQMYFRIERYGWWWYGASIVLMIFMHDTYFYWTHRLLHHPRLFKHMHRVHHLSTSPSPWAAYSFSWSEAFVQAGISPLITFTIPNHPSAFAIFMLWQIGFNVMGHCGYEVFPRWFLRSGLGRFFNTLTHHVMHHESYSSNYGLYFNFWDRLMGTNHRHYAERFAEVTGDASVQQAESKRIWQPEAGGAATAEKA